MFSMRLWTRYAMAALLCLPLVLLSGCPWDKDDDEDCPYRGERLPTVPSDTAVS